MKRQILLILFGLLSKKAGKPRRFYRVRSVFARFFFSGHLGCFSLFAYLFTPLPVSQIHAAEIRVAAAANFTAPMKEIAALFEKETGHRVVLSFGSSGSLYAQIKQGAPFDLYFAADESWTARLIKEGFADGETQQVYALGTLVLWSKKPGFVDKQGKVLESNQFQKLALANPALAPYGAAAREILSGLENRKSSEWRTELESKIVMGQSVAQTYQFIASENAQLGFISISQIMRNGKISEGSYWIIPPDLYSPIRQSAVLLSKAEAETPAASKKAALDFLQFMQSEPASAVIQAYGYGLPNSSRKSGGSARQ